MLHLIRFAFLRKLLPSALLLACLVAAAACGGSSSACMPEPPVECTPSINTDFASLHKNILSQRCGTSGGACHGPSGKQGNLVLSDPQTAYSALLGKDGTATRVIPGDPSCSLLMQRLESDDPQRRMPRGENKLPDGLRCAIRRWIEEGAAP